MSNEEIQETVERAELEYEMLKDKVHDQYDEIQRLNNIINKAINFINNFEYYIPEDNKEELLNILNGGDKE